MYNQEENSLDHKYGEYWNDTFLLPEHFRNKPLRALAQVWNSNTAFLTQETLYCAYNSDGFPNDGKNYPND